MKGELLCGIGFLILFSERVNDKSCIFLKIRYCSMKCTFLSHSDSNI